MWVLFFLIVAALFIPIMWVVVVFYLLLWGVVWICVGLDKLRMLGG